MDLVNYMSVYSQRNFIGSFAGAVLHYRLFGSDIRESLFLIPKNSNP